MSHIHNPLYIENILQYEKNNKEKDSATIKEFVQENIDCMECFGTQNFTARAFTALNNFCVSNELKMYILCLYKMKPWRLERFMQPFFNCKWRLFWKLIPIAVANNTTNHWSHCEGHQLFFCFIIIKHRHFERPEGEISAGKLTDINNFNSYTVSNMRLNSDIILKKKKKHFSLETASIPIFSIYMAVYLSICLMRGRTVLH